VIGAGAGAVAGAATTAAGTATGATVSGWTLGWTAGWPVGWVAGWACLRQVFAIAWSLAARPGTQRQQYQYRASDFIKRIISYPLPESVSQLENDVNNGRGIYGLSIAHSWFEAHLACGSDGGFIQTMSEAANHSLYLHVAVSREQNLQQTCPSSFKSRASWV